jgi:hypothetical protein
MSVCGWRSKCRGLAVLAALVAAGCGPDELPSDPIVLDSGLPKQDAAPPKLDAAVTPDAATTPDAPVDGPSNEADAGGQEDVATEPDVGMTPDADDTSDTGVVADALDTVDTAGTSDTAPAADAEPGDTLAADTLPPVPPTPCDENTPCTEGTCVTGTCRASSGLLLYWSFDDPDGSPTVSDSSGNGFDGTYISTPATDAGTGTPPAYSTDVSPTIQFANPSCRSYDLNQRQAALLVGALPRDVPAPLKVANNFSVSAWFRVKNMTVDTGTGSEVFSAGDVYSLRVYAAQLEFSKRTNKLTAGMLDQTGGSHVQVKGTATTHLDGNWHHLAGVATPDGMTVYLDGVLLLTKPTATDLRAGADVRYDRGTDLCVGRHCFNNVNYDFHGEIDDVRIYNHPMTQSDVTWLASGKP